MSEEIVIAGWINRPDTYEPYLSLSRDSHSSVLSEPLMTVAQHKRIVEQYKRDAERMRDLLCRARAFVDAWDDDSQEFMDLCGDIDNAISQQQAEVKL